MSEIKAMFPIGKTQWRKWNDAQRTAFNETRAAGVPFPDAVKYVNENDVWDAPEIVEAPKKKKDILDVLEDAVETVAEVVAVASPVVAVAKGVARTASKAKKGK